MSAIDDLLESLRRSGVAIRAHQGRLQLRPRTGVDAATLAEIERYKPALLVRLASGAGARPTSPPSVVTTSVAPREAAPDRDPPWPRGPQHCMTCWGTRFVDLRDGHRWACFTCAAAAPGDVIAECDNGPERPERARAGERDTEVRAAGVRTADRATQSQTFCGGEVSDDPKRPRRGGSNRR